MHLCICVHSRTHVHTHTDIYLFSHFNCEIQESENTVFINTVIGTIKLLQFKKKQRDLFDI